MLYQAILATVLVLASCGSTAAAEALDHSLVSSQQAEELAAGYEAGATCEPILDWRLIGPCVAEAAAADDSRYVRLGLSLRQFALLSHRKLREPGNPPGVEPETHRLQCEIYQEQAALGVSDTELIELTGASRLRDRWFRLSEMYRNGIPGGACRSREEVQAADPRQMTDEERSAAAEQVLDEARAGLEALDHRARLPWFLRGIVPAPAARAFSTPVYNSQQCTGAIVDGVCHGAVIGPPKATCHGELLNGQCTGPMF